MRPDQRWFPTNRAERAAWFGHFADRFSEVGLSLGFTQDEIDAVNADNAVVQFAATSLILLESAMRSAREFERTITGGNDNGSRPGFPAIDIPTPPTMVTAGIYARLERLVRRIRLARGYNASIGVLLGIIPSNTRRIRPQEFVPTIKVIPLDDAYTFSVRTPMLNFSGMEVRWKRADSLDRENTVRFFRSPAKLTITPATPGLPEQLSVRIRMLKGDHPITALSPIAMVTVNP